MNTLGMLVAWMPVLLHPTAALIKVRALSLSLRRLDQTMMRTCSGGGKTCPSAIGDAVGRTLLSR